MALMDEAAVSYQAVLTKIDKLKPTELSACSKPLRRPAQARRRLSSAACDILADEAGIAELRAEIARLAKA